jgi:K+-sensing histidine kinase KdpD
MFATSIGGLTALAVAGLLVPVRDAIHNANVALTLAVVVVAAAAVGGRRAGVVTASVAALSFDFLHTQPYQSLKIAGPDDVLTTALLVVLGFLAGEVAERLHRARQRRSEIGELQRLRRVTDRASFGDTSEDLTLQVSAELLDALHLRDCWYEAAPFLGDLPVLEPDGTIADRVHRWAAGGFELPRDGASILLWSAGRLVGRFVVTSTAGVGVPVERRVVAVTLVEQLGLVLALRAA